LFEEMQQNGSPFSDPIYVSSIPSSVSSFTTSSFAVRDELWTD
jgi:hypothetical protein